MSPHYDEENGGVFYRDHSDTIWGAVTGLIGATLVLLACTLFGYRT